MSRNHRVTQLLGWYGVVAIVGAYTLTSFSILNPQDWQSQLLNATGAISMVIQGSERKDWQPVALNVIWAAIAIIGLIRGFIS